MPFAYYAKLKPRQKAIYRSSEAIAEIELPRGALLEAPAEHLRLALERGKRGEVEAATNALSNALLAQLGLAGVPIKVLAVRPSEGSGELHGLYQPAENGHRAAIKVWMRTAHHKKVVAFKTFLRTLLHELCHHLDYAHLRLEDSFHTEGFFKRESSLYHQIMQSPPRASASALADRKRQAR
jgi:hypothetical protein